MEALALQIGRILFSQYGVLGAVVTGLVIFIVWMIKTHNTDRKELVKTITDQNDRMINAFDRNTTVLSEVKTLIQTMDR
jgi:predicted HTH transcriptional regulator